MFIKEIHAYLSNKARITNRHTFRKEKEFSDKRGGAVLPGPNPKSTLVGWLQKKELTVDCFKLL